MEKTFGNADLLYKKVIDMSAPLPLSALSFGLDSSLGDATLVQTHIGWVYLIGAYAFKLKKHVKFDFLDFTTLEKRRWACEREIVLNSRLCPEIYIGLRAVEEQADGVKCLVKEVDASNTGSPTAARATRIVDWAVWMRRLPAERMADLLLKNDAVERKDVEGIADVLAPFYLQQRGLIAPGGLGDLAAVTFNIEENLREGAGLDQGLLDSAALSFIGRRARSFLKEHGELVSERARQGFVVDGHGDLRSENICLPLNAAPVLFDCIEFNDRFRIGDSALDIAYLAMDLDARGRGDLSRAFLKRYTESCDARLSPLLLNFYLGYRAFVKGKVQAWIAGDANVEAAHKQHAADEAKNLFDLCVRYALPRRPFLILLCGVSGSGKSTLARNLAQRLRWAHLATDLIRDEIVPRGTPPALRYAPENSASVYQVLGERARQALTGGQSVICDGTFTWAASRSELCDEAHRAGALAILIWVDCEPGRAAAHIEKRQACGESFGSEADAAISINQRLSFQNPSADESFDAFISIPTDQSLEASLSRMWHALLNSFAALPEN